MELMDELQYVGDIEETNGSFSFRCSLYDTRLGIVRAAIMYE